MNPLPLRRPCLAPGLTAALLLLGGTLAAQSRTVTLTADRDNSIYEEGDLSNGAGTRMFTGATFAAVSRRALLRFDVAGAIPPGSTIRSADLQLEVVMLRTGAPATRVDAFRVTTDWGEGTSFAARGQGGGAAATTDDATWRHARFPNRNWNNLGGDFASSSLASAPVNALGPVTLASTAALVADVQSMLDAPGRNFGFLLRGDERTPGAAVAWSTREEPNMAARPQLAITYDPPTATASTFGTGCAALTPFALAPVGVPSLGNQGFGIQASGAAGLQLTSASFAYQRLNNSLPLPSTNCPVWLDPTTIFTALAFPQPGGLLALPVPNNSDLLGVPLFVQGIAASGAALRPVTSNGVALRFGI